MLITNKRASMVYPANSKFERQLYEIEQNIGNELRPLLDKIRMMPKENLVAFKEAYLKFRERDESSWNKILYLISEGSKGLPKIASVNEQVLSLFFYLGMVESLGNCYVDMLVMLIVANGRDFHIESRYSTPRIRHVVSVDDLEKENIPLGIKLHFLEDNGLACFASVIDTTLRNDIAHLKFSVTDKGIKVRGHSVNESIEPAYQKILLAVTLIDIHLSELAKDMGWKKVSKKDIEP